MAEARRIPGRGALSIALIVISTALGLAGGVALYARQELVAPKAFSDRAVTALQHQEVRSVVSREIVVQLVDRGSTDLISARPVIQSVVDFVVASEPFRKLFRKAAEQGHRLLFERNSGNVVFDVADAGTVISSALTSVSPTLAKKIPSDFDAHLAKLRSRSFATGTLRFADTVRLLGIVLPLMALVGFALAILVAPDRRAAVTRSGIAIGTGCALLVAVLLVLRAYVIGHVYGSDELTNEDVRDATRVILDSFAGDLVTAALLLGAFSLLVAAASASLFRPFEAGRGLARVRRVFHAPAAPRWRALHGAGLVLIGVLVALEPRLSLELAAIAAGALLIYIGTGELLSAIAPVSRGAAAGARRPLWPAVAAGATVLAACAVGLVILINSGSKSSEAKASTTACNGYVALCDRPLNDVVFPGTHNSMSAADSKGWLLANQRRNIPRQLKDGIRLFLIDPHYGVQDSSGKVRTDFAAEKRATNRVGSKLSPEATQALYRVGGSLGLGKVEGGKRDVWLCHSVCELGATKMVDALTDIRKFLERNPREVVIIFDEDYVSEDDLAKVYRRSGLYPYLATLDRDKPLPTLRQLIDSGKRVIVFTERDPSGQYPWDHAGFSFIQDTPLGATKPSAFQCRRNRGEVDSPILMINNWIDRFPPPLSANRAVLKKSFILDRARRCSRERGLHLSLIASDFYDQGHLVEAVRELNGVKGKPAPTR